MGSGGKKKSRKGGKRQHLPKVGTPDDIRLSQSAERHMVMQDVGIPVDRLERSTGGRVLMWFAGVLVVLIVVGAVVSLIALG